MVRPARSVPTDIVVRQNRQMAHLTRDVDSAAEKARAQPEKLLREMTEIDSEPAIDLDNQFIYRQELKLANLVSYTQYSRIPEMTESDYSTS